jgi:thiol-disulfide isomerase/thioredoxin
MHHRGPEPFGIHRMDRLSPVKLLILLLGLLAGCPEKTREAPPSRYQAVKANSEAQSRWCDTDFGSPGPRLTLPPLAPPPTGQAPLALPKGKRIWVNLWATWCQPCLREIPLLLSWQSDLRKDGLDVEVILLSLDEDAPTLDQFLAGRKDLQAAKIARAASQRDYEQWIKAYAKDPSLPIPIHLLASADGHLRCLRNGSLREGDYPAAKASLH